MSDNLRQQSAAFRILRGIFAGYFLIQAIIWPLFGLGFLAYLSVIGAFELKDAVHIGDRGYIIGTGLLTVIPFLIGVFLIHALRGQMSRRVISKIGPLFYLTMASLLGIILSYLNPKLLLLVSAGLVPILAFTYRVRSIWRIRRILYRMLIIVVFFLAIFSKTLGAHGPTILIAFGYASLSMPGFVDLFELWRLLPGPSILVPLRRRKVILPSDPKTLRRSCLRISPCLMLSGSTVAKLS